MTNEAEEPHALLNRVRILSFSDDLLTRRRHTGAGSSVCLQICGPKAVLIPRIYEKQAYNLWAFGR